MPAYSSKFTIPASVDKFTIDFALLNYTDPESNKYAYKLEGYNDSWQFLPTGNHRATFENLPPGKYSLKLKASDNYGEWQELDYAITIRVLPPWYRSWWAYILYLIVAAVAAYAGVTRYKVNLKNKNRLQMAVVFTNIAHELLTPLSVISATVDNLRVNTPQNTDSYDAIQGNINRLTRLLRQILEVRKSQAGQLKLLVGTGDLASFIASECEIVRPLAEQKGLNLQVETVPTTGYFDPDKIGKIVQNLLSNSIKYSIDNGRITVSLTNEAGMAVLIVDDNGIGIPAEKMKNLYQRFLDGDYRRMNTMGTGIGLSLTRDLVRLHHGTINCESKEGIGTKFTIKLPLDRTSYTDDEVDDTMIITAKSANEVMIAAETVVMDATANNDGGPNKEHSILIVEDNAELLTLMASLLSPQYNVYTARDGQKALNIIKRKELDIVVSDVMMPIMNGIELTKAIKQNPDTAQLPVVLLTAKTTNEDRNEAYSSGADSYLTKPLKIEELRLRIDNIILNRERVLRKFSRQTEFKVEEQHYSSPDERFVQKAIDCVKAHLSDGDYDRDAFALDMCVSGSTLYNKLRALTGQNITGFINSIRLKEACRIARGNPSISVAELSAIVGFNSPKYFSKCFKKEFGMLLKEYVESVEK